MRPAPLAWHWLRWPREVTAEQITQAFRLLASVAGQPVVIEGVGSSGLVEHHLALPASGAESMVDQLRAAIPGLAVESVAERPVVTARHAVELRLSTRRRSLHTGDIASVNRAIVTALAHVRGDERLTIQWVLGRSLPAQTVSN